MLAFFFTGNKPQMNRSIRTPSIILFGLFTGLMVHVSNADTGLDIEYAERMPLAADSMLLDITRIGDTFVAVGERGHVVKSKDGETWEQADVVPTRSTLTSVVNWGTRLWAAGHDAVILTSGDSGKTWSREFYDPDRQKAFMDIVFSSKNDGMAIGSYGLFLKTSDGGKNWQKDIVDPDSDYHLNSMLILDNYRRIIAGEAGYSYRSFDDGSTWEPMNMPYQGSMWGALETEAGCILFYGLRGHIIESCDFGTSWTELETGVESSISDAAEHDGLVLLAANSGTILIRDDGGSFTAYKHSSGVDFAAVLSLNDGNFLLVGEGGVHRYPETTGEEDRND